MNRPVYGTIEPQPHPPRVFTESQKRARLAKLESDALWKRGPEAAAEHMIACWREIGLVDEWDSDGPLWRRVDAQLQARFDTDEARHVAHKEIRDRYLALLLEAMG